MVHRQSGNKQGKAEVCRENLLQCHSAIQTALGLKLAHQCHNQGTSLWSCGTTKSNYVLTELLHIVL
jgi:hypothetical protein